VDVVLTGVSEECIASIFRVEGGRWRRYVPPERWLVRRLLGATSRKTAFFIVTAVNIFFQAWIFM
jgi:hypothetical protein